MKICIDPGHGGRDKGSTGRINKRPLLEKNVVLIVALYLEVYLQQAGHRVYLTRRADRTLSLSARTRFANRHAVDLFISLHCNSAYTNKASGFETWIHPYSDVARRYAQPIQAQLSKTFPTHKDRGIKEANFHVLRETRMPAVLVEMEFINNPVQARFLSSERNQKKIAAAIAGGI